MFLGTYAEILKPETIESCIERAYSPERVASRIADDQFYIAEDATGIAAFADALEREDRLDLLAIYAFPTAATTAPAQRFSRSSRTSFPAWTSAPTS